MRSPGNLPPARRWQKEKYLNENEEDLPMRPWELAAMAWQSWSMSTFSVVKRERSTVAAIILIPTV